MVEIFSIVDWPIGIPPIYPASSFVLEQLKLPLMLYSMLLTVKRKVTAQIEKKEIFPVHISV